MEENNHVQFSSPLSVGFYKWDELSCPSLKFTKFLVIKWNAKTEIARSEVWSDPEISNVIFAGTKTGVILTYKITSQNYQLKRIEPLCFLFGHSSPITSLVKCKQSLYDLCAASLSSDGTISIISVVDLTIIKNAEYLFSENSQDLTIHQTNMRLALASQTFGTIEIADIYDEKILMRVDGFTSTVYSLISYGTLNTVACIDGSMNVFAFNSKKIECLYSFKRNENPPCFSIFSPHFVFLLVVSSKQWSVHISNSSIYGEELKETDDFYSNAGWVNDSLFFLQTFNGCFEFWKFPKIDPNEQASVIENLSINQSFFSVKTKEDVLLIKTQMNNKKISVDDENELKKKFKKPKLVYKCNSVIGPIAVTTEGFIISSKSFDNNSEKMKSVIFCKDTLNNTISFDLKSIYKSDVICRCSIGDPITSEARIMSDFSIWVNDKKIGTHTNAKMLFSPSKSSAFFSFSKDGSVKAFSEDQFITSFYDLSEPITNVQYVNERDWIIVIGKYSSFSVISTRSMQSVALCTGHNSPVMNVSYSNGILHALCTSAMLYSWNVEGQLVSKRMVKFQKPVSEFGEMNSSENLMKLNKSNENQLKIPKPVNKPIPTSPNQIPKSSSLSNSSCFYVENNTIFEDLSLFEDKEDFDSESFYKIKSLIMPNCQTYCIVLDVFKFLSSYQKFSSFNTMTNPELFLAVLLWKRHVGSSKVNIDFPQKTADLLNKFYLTITGDNFTVTLPINKKIYEIENEKEIDQNTCISIDDYKYNKKISFYFSPLTTSIHTIASSTLAQCFINSSINENLLLVSSLSQTLSTDLLDSSKNLIQPSIPILASYLLFQSENLETILLNFISYLMGTFDENKSSNILFNIEHLFGNWKVILPFVLIHCTNFSSLPKLFASEAQKHLFPTILEKKEIFNLLKNCFSNFSEYITDIDGFFQKLINECIQNHNKIESQITSIAVSRPFEFFNSAIINQSNRIETTNLIVMMIKKLINPDRTILMSMVSHAVSMQKSGYFVNIDEVFSSIMKNNLFFAYSKSYAAFGDVNGYIHLISMESGSNVWATKKIKNEKSIDDFKDDKDKIIYVSFSPSGARLIFVDSEFDITWISISVGKKQENKDKFGIIGSYNLKTKINASEISWKGESTVDFLMNQKIILETHCPKMSFFEKVADKFVSSK